MDQARRMLRLTQLDRLLAELGEHIPPTPMGGWIKSIREAKGLSLDAFAQRLGLASRSTANQLERAEMDGSITIKRMRAAANALGCDLAVVLVPRQPLATEQLQEEETELLASYRRIGHSMSLEGQMVAEDRLKEIGQLAAQRSKPRAGT